jgi:hypothetical protein
MSRRRSTARHNIARIELLPEHTRFR